MNLDQYIEGDFNYYNPCNNSDYEPEERNIESIQECLTLGDTDKAYDLIGELIKEVNSLRDYANTNENVWLLKRLNLIYSKL